MNVFKTTVIAAAVIAVAGCANNAQQDYYLAMSQAAQANAATQQMRFAALTAMAQNGDAASKTAAVMAIALTNNDVVAPRYIESDALKWASVLAPVASTLTLGLVQADVSKNSSNNSKDIALNAQNNNTIAELGSQQLVGGIVTSGNVSRAAGYVALTDVAITSIDTMGVITETAITQPPWAVTVVDPVIVEPIIVDPVIVEVPVVETP
jgi:hypothetical protein